MATVCGTVVALAYSRPPGGSDFLQGPRWLDGWYQFDSGWYYDIATQGYAFTPGRQSSVAFFPAYPLLVRGVGSVIGDYQLAGTLLSMVAGAAGVALFAFWVCRRLPSASAKTAVVVLLVYPYSFFLYGAMYSDALFLLTAVGALLLLESRHYVLAGLVGAVATAGRLVGVALVIGLLVRVVEMRAERAASQPKAPGPAKPAEPQRVSLRRLVGSVRLLRWPEAAVGLSALGLLGWVMYLGVRFGDPLAFFTTQSSPGWDQGSGPRTWFKVGFFGQLIKGGEPRLALTLAAQALVCLLAVLLLRRVWRRFGWGYFVFSVVALAIPIIGTKDFMGTGRYLLAAFPVLAAAGDWLATTRHARWLRPVVVGLCVCGLLVATGLYSRGLAVS